MSQPQPVQPPTYRRSWLGRVIVLALVVQWAGLWYRSIQTEDFAWVARRKADGNVNAVYFCSIDSGMNLRILNGWSEDWEPDNGGGGGPLEGVHFASGPSTNLVQFPLLPIITSTTDSEVSAIWVFVPYWQLIILTLLAYFAIGRVPRWRINRRAKRVGTTI